MLHSLFIVAGQQQRIHTQAMDWDVQQRTSKQRRLLQTPCEELVSSSEARLPLRPACCNAGLRAAGPVRTVQPAE